MTEEQKEVFDQTDIVLNILQKAREWSVARKVAEVRQHESKKISHKAAKDLLEAENDLLGVLELLYPDDLKDINKKNIVLVN